MKRVHLVIIGKVQGINFRHDAKKKAIELGITGWARNVDDKVEIMAEGNEKRLEEFLEWCRQGPERALVEFVQIENEKYTGEFKKFEIRY